MEYAHWCWEPPIAKIILYKTETGSLSFALNAPVASQYTFWNALSSSYSYCTMICSTEIVRLQGFPKQSSLHSVLFRLYSVLHSTLVCQIVGSFSANPNHETPITTASYLFYSIDFATAPPLTHCISITTIENISPKVSLVFCMHCPHYHPKLCMLPFILLSGSVKLISAVLDLP